MSILIKDMEVPRNEPLLIKLNPDGSVSTTAKNGYRKYAAIPIPPHGRLIDADALHKLFEDQWHYLQVLDWNENPTAEAKQSGINWCINTMHDEAPTVIPASSNYNEGDNDAKLLTNQVAMTRLSPEEFYNKMDWLLHRYGTQFNSTRLAVINWLKQEVE